MLYLLLARKAADQAVGFVVPFMCRHHNVEKLGPWKHHYIMAGRAFGVAEEVFWHGDDGYMTKNNSFDANSAMSIIICTQWLILIT